MSEALEAFIVLGFIAPIGVAAAAIMLDANDGGKWL